MTYMRGVARWAARAVALSAHLAARVVISNNVVRWRGSYLRAQHVQTLVTSWLRRIAGALYATPPDRRVKAAVLLGLAWKKPTLRFRAAFLFSISGWVGLVWGWSDQVGIVWSGRACGG